MRCAVSASSIYPRPESVPSIVRQCSSSAQPRKLPCHLAGLHEFVIVRGMSGQRQQARLFLGEGLTHREPVIAGPGTPIGHLLAPLPDLAVALFQSGEAAARPVGFAQEADRAIDAAFLLRSAHLTGTRNTVVVGT